MECWTKIEGGVTAARGFKANGVESGIKKKGGLDLALVFSEYPATAAGVFTTNVVAAAPVIVSKEHLSDGKARAVILNSGNANACLGEEGLRAARTMAEHAGESLGVSAQDLLVASTGVIGTAFPLEKGLAGIGPLVKGLTTSGGHTAAQAIMTTDTISKEVALEFTIQGQPVRIGGMAKGSGMIQPNMATMLSVVTTDLGMPANLLKQALLAATRVTFNRITVDGDMSTNDSIFLLANGSSGVTIANEGDDFATFQAALTEVLKVLARMVAGDGEGATKLIDVIVTGAHSEEEAEKAARSVANSNLVKTAFFGEDANCGRIIAAVGYSGIMFEPAKTVISIGDLVVFENGVGLAFDEEKAAQILAEREIRVLIELHQGSAEATVWTCDFSYDYVKINGSYRT